MNRPSKTIKRLWLTAGALATFLLALAIGNALAPVEKRLTTRMLGHDFLAFYTAGAFVRDGHPHDLYDLPKVQAFQHALAARESLEIGQSFGPFWNPPFYAWPFVPLAALPYPQALATWWAINLAALALALLLLCRLMRGGSMPSNTSTPLRNASKPSFAPHPLAPSSPHLAHSTTLLPLLLLATMPFVQALSHGQNTFISLAILSVGITLWARGRNFAAGAVAGLLLYKPQLGVIVAGALILTGGRRALAGVALTSLALAAVTLLTLPGTIDDYRRLMPGNLRQFQVVQPYLWDRHVTLRAFWRMLLQGRAPGEMGTPATACWIASCTLLFCGLALTGWKISRRPAPHPLTPSSPHLDAHPHPARDSFLAAVIVAMPLLMPFYFDYDLLLVAVAVVLCARSAMIDGVLARPLFWATCALVIQTMVNSTLTRLTGVNGTVLFLCALEVLLLRRTLLLARIRRDFTPKIADPSDAPLATAA